MKETLGQGGENEESLDGDTLPTYILLTHTSDEQERGRKKFDVGRLLAGEGNICTYFTVPTREEQQMCTSEHIQFHVTRSRVCIRRRRSYGLTSKKFSDQT